MIYPRHFVLIKNKIKKQQLLQKVYEIFYVKMINGTSQLAEAVRIVF